MPAEFTPDEVGRLRSEWTRLEEELQTRFEILRDALQRLEDGEADLEGVVPVVRGEIDVCLDRLNGIKDELADIWKLP